MSNATARLHLSSRLLAVGLISICLAVSGCGRKGPLETPPDLKPGEEHLPVRNGQPPQDGDRPSRHFILDGLL